MFKQYRWNFVFVVLLVAIIGFAIFDIFLYYSIQNFLFHQTFEEIRIKTSIATSSFSAAIPKEMFEGVPQLWELTHKLKEITNARVTIIDSTGRVLTDSDVSFGKIDTLENHLHRPEVQQALRSGWGQDYRLSATVHKKLFYSAFRVENNGKTIGFLRFAYYARNFEESVNKILKYIILANFVGLIVLFIAAYYLGSLVTYPILRIVKTAQKIAEGDLERDFHTNRRDEVGKLSRILSNLTSRLKTQIQQISHERQKLAYILSQLNTGILAINNEREILHANSALGEMVGLNSEEIIGKKFDELAPLKPMVHAIDSCLKSKSSTNGEFSYHRNRAKRFISYQIGIFEISETDKYGALVQLHDISELKKLEAIRKNFVASASHELKTPLTSIIGYAETLKEGALQSREKSLRFVNRILDQAQRLEYLVSDLLKLSRLEHDSPMNEGDFRLTEIIDSVIEEFTQKAKQKKITLTKKIFDDNIIVRVDRELMHTVMENLVDNAIKYTPQEGKVTVSILPAKNGFVRVAVRDTGIGIDPKYHLRIFQRFYRVDKARSRKIGGTGLGLAIVKHILERHGSQIFIDSELGKGSCFYFELKRVDA